MNIACNNEVVYTLYTCLFSVLKDFPPVYPHQSAEESLLTSFLSFIGSPGKQGFRGSNGTLKYPFDSGELLFPGDKGFPGSLGAPGPPGDVGDKGLRGLDGMKGMMGSKVQFYCFTLDYCKIFKNRTLHRI